MAVAEWGKLSKEEKEEQARKCECSRLRPFFFFFFLM